MKQKSKTFTFLGVFVVTLVFLQVLPSHAIQGGASALGDRNTVKLGGCGGFLYAPRIVLTAQHCLYNPTTKPASLLEPYQIDVFSPGSISDRPIAGEKYFVPEGFAWYNSDGYSTFGKDFAVLVLSKPHQFSGKSEIADLKIINDYISKGTEVTIVGFGKRYKDDTKEQRPPMKANFRLATNLEATQIIAEYKTRYNRTGIYGPTLHAFIPYGETMTCDGDSGSPLFFRSGDITTYLGASSGISGTPNCGADQEWGKSGGMQSVEPAYLYLDLIHEAEKYVQQHPYKPESYSVTCKTKQGVREFFELTPKCPTGTSLFLAKGKPKEGSKCNQFGLVSGKLTCAQWMKKNVWFKISLSSSKNSRPIEGTACLSNELEALGYNKFQDLVPLNCNYRGAILSWKVSQI